MGSSTQPGIGPTSSPRVLERSTRQRRIIRAVFDNTERPLSIEEVLAAAQRCRKAAVSLSTVYRFVRSLVDDGSLSVFELPGQGAFYELAGKAHHHHFSCIRCGRVYELMTASVSKNWRCRKASTRFRTISRSLASAPHATPTASLVSCAGTKPSELLARPYRKGLVSRRSGGDLN